MKKTMVLVSLMAALMVAGYVVAQTGGGAQGAGARPAPAAGAPHGSKPGPGPGPGMGMGPGMCGGGHMAGDMMGPGMGHCPMCGMLMGPGTKMDVKNAPKGVTISLTSDDPKAVARMQKAAEIMRLQRELMMME